jgi:hypothetical protein
MPGATGLRGKVNAFMTTRPIELVRAVRRSRPLLDIVHRRTPENAARLLEILLDVDATRPELTASVP